MHFYRKIVNFFFSSWLSIGFLFQIGILPNEYQP